MILNVLKHHWSLKELVEFLFRYLMSILLNVLLCDATRVVEYKWVIKRKLENDCLSHVDGNIHTSSGKFLNFVRLLGLVKFG